MVSSLVKDLQFPFFSSSHPTPCIFKTTYVTHTQDSSTKRQPHQTLQTNSLHLFQALTPSQCMRCKLICKLCKLEARVEWKSFSLALTTPGPYTSPAAFPMGSWMLLGEALNPFGAASWASMGWHRRVPHSSCPCRWARRTISFPAQSPNTTRQLRAAGLMQEARQGLQLPFREMLSGALGWC